MIVVGIIGILTVIAYPSYQNYLKRAHRSAAESLMLDLANREQQYLLDQRSFLGGGASAVTTLLSPLPVPPEVSPYYDVAIDGSRGAASDVHDHRGAQVRHDHGWGWRSHAGSSRNQAAR